MNIEYDTGADGEIATSLAEQDYGFQSQSNLAVERRSVARDYKDMYEWTLFLHHS